VAGFSLSWLLILLAGADCPLPLGFVWLLPLLLVGALLVYWRAPAYAKWKSQFRPWLILRVFAEGTAAGLGTAALLHAVPWSGEPSVRPSGMDALIGLAVLGALGAANSLIAYMLARGGNADLPPTGEG